MIFLLALRNLFRNKRNTLLLVLLVAFITMIFFIGNSFLSQSDRGLRKTYADNLTADLMIQRTQDISMNLFGANTPVIDEFFVMPVLPAYQEIRDALEFPGVSGVASIVSGKAAMDFGGVRQGAALLGVESPDYFSLFPGLELLDGEILEQSIPGVMLSQKMIESLDHAVAIGDPVKLTMAYGTGFRIREVPLVGIFGYKNPGPYMEQIVLVDPQTLRSLSSVLSEAAEEVDVSDDALDLLDGSLDDLFGDGDFFSSNDEDQFSISDLEADLSSQTEKAVTVSGGDWNFILIRVEDGLRIPRLKKQLNNMLSSYGVTVVDWRTAAGNTAMSVLFIQFFFYGGIILISVAGIISIVNIMLISVFKRTREIGTLRALGASDITIAGLILLENLFLSLIAGILGIAIAWLGIRFLNHLEIPFGNSLITSLFGTKFLYIELIPSEAIRSILVAVGLGVCSAIYPGAYAIKINPIEAVRRG